MPVADAFFPFMTLQQTKAVVLAVSSYGEADKIVTFYGPETGKLKGIAKGAQRSRIRFVNKLELFSLLEISYEEGRRSGLVRLDQAELLHPYATIRGDYPSYAAASLVGELVRLWTREADADPRLFALLTWVLAAIDQLPSPRHGHSLAPPVIFFETKLLELLGYRPDLGGCLACGTLDQDRRPYHFSLGAGGLLCTACHRESRHGLIPLSLATARILAKAQELPTAKLNRLRLPPASAREALNFLHHYSRHLLQREIHARDCLLQTL